MYPLALNDSVYSSLIGTEFPTRIKGVQQMFFFKNIENIIA